MPWFCLITNPKHEAVAATTLRREIAADSCCPRVSYIKKTARGPVRFTEALFPGYLFAQFDEQSQLRHVLSIHGIRGIVRYGSALANIPQSIIDELKTAFGPTEIRVLAQPELVPDTEVLLVRGPLENLKAIVTHYHPAKDRVRVLLDLLGRPTEIEVPRADVLVPVNNPKQQ